MTEDNHDQELTRTIWHSYELYDHPDLEQGTTDTERSENGDNISITTCPHLEMLSITKLHQTIEHNCDPGLQRPSPMRRKLDRLHINSFNNLMNSTTFPEMLPMEVWMRLVHL